LTFSWRKTIPTPPPPPPSLKRRSSSCLHHSRRTRSWHPSTMLTTIFRAARPLRSRVPILALGNPAQASSPPGRLGREGFHTTRCRTLATKPPLQPTKIDKEFEREVAQKKLEARPDEVTSASSVRHVIESSQAPPPENPDIMVGIKGDLVSLLRIVPLFAAPTPPLTQTWPPPIEYHQRHVRAIRRPSGGICRRPCRHPSLPSHLALHRAPLVESEHAMADGFLSPQQLHVQQ
jgi:hypothetical protein